MLQCKKGLRKKLQKSMIKYYYVQQKHQRRFWWYFRTSHIALLIMDLVEDLYLLSSSLFLRTISVNNIKEKIIQNNGKKFTAKQFLIS